MDKEPCANLKPTAERIVQSYLDTDPLYIAQLMYDLGKGVATNDLISEQFEPLAESILEVIQSQSFTRGTN